MTPSTNTFSDEDLKKQNIVVVIKVKNKDKNDMDQK